MNSVTDSAKVAIKSEEITPRRGYIFNNRAIFPIPTHTIGSALGLGCKIQATKVQKHPPTHACLPLRRLSHRKSYHTIHATALTCTQHSVPTTQTSPPPYLDAPQKLPQISQIPPHFPPKAQRISAICTGQPAAGVRHTAAKCSDVHATTSD